MHAVEMKRLTRIYFLRIRFNAMMGIDSGKTVLHFVGLGARGEVVAHKKDSWTQWLRFTSNIRGCLFGMEACGGAHFPGRVLRERGLVCLFREQSRHPAGSQRGRKHETQRRAHTVRR